MSRGVLVDPRLASDLAHVLEEHARAAGLELMPGTRLGDAYDAFVALARTGSGPSQRGSTAAAPATEYGPEELLGLAQALSAGLRRLEQLAPAGELAGALIASAVTTGDDEPLDGELSESAADGEVVQDIIERVVLQARALLELHARAELAAVLLHRRDVGR